MSDTEQTFGEPAAGEVPQAEEPRGDSPVAEAPTGNGAGEHAEQALGGDVAELVATAAQRDEYLALAQRTQADFENYRKRVAREAAVAVSKGVAKLAKEILPALDSLDRALDSAAQDDPLIDGVRLVRSELNAALARVGVTSFSPAGEPFDPVQHEAMAQVQHEDAPSGSVVEVYQAGYRMGETILRPARVVVAA